METSEYPFPQQVVLRCMSCTQSIHIDNPNTEKWKMCDHCGSILCPACLADRIRFSENLCPGSKGGTLHKIKAVILDKDAVKTYCTKIIDDIDEDLVFKLFIKPRHKASLATLFTPKHGNSRLLTPIEQFWKDHKLIIARTVSGPFFDLRNPQEVFLSLDTSGHKSPHQEHETSATS